VTASKLIEGNESSLFMCKRCGVSTRHRRIYWRRRFPLGYLARKKWIEGWLCPECGMRIRVRPVEGLPPAATQPHRDGDETATTTNGKGTQ
jgi:predicted RNA-binding Zn-ribbon protein involved in translation (DUF1610 family)